MAQPIEAPKQDVVDQKYLPIETAMERYKVSRSFLYKLKSQRRLSFFSLGSRVFISRDELENLIAAGRKS